MFVTCCFCGVSIFPLFNGYLISWGSACCETCLNTYTIAEFPITVLYSYKDLLCLNTIQDSAPAWISKPCAQKTTSVENKAEKDRSDTLNNSSKDIFFRTKEST